jgi:hypothetical protein
MVYAEINNCCSMQKDYNRYFDFLFSQLEKVTASFNKMHARIKKLILEEAF